MSDSTQQWILRKPLKAFVENDQYDEACYAVVADDGLAWQFMDKESFDELFKFVDIPAIEKQLEQILDRLTDKHGWDDVGQELRDEALAEIKVLFGLENNQRQNFEPEEVASKIIDEQIEDEEERQKVQDAQSRLFWADAIKYECKVDSAYTRAGESYLAKEITGDLWRILLPIRGGDVVIPDWLFRQAFGFSIPVEGDKE